MTDRPIRTSSSTARRMMGLLIAAGVTLVFGGVFLFMSVQRGQDGPGGSGAPLPKDIVDIGEAPTTASASTDPNLIQVGEHGRIQSADKDDPSRLAWELNFERLDPVGPGYYTLSQPRAWVYLRDGRTLYVRADSGRVKMPAKTKQPESGEFRGHVVLRMFSPSALAAAKAGVVGAVVPIDPEKDEPTIVGLTDSINFDMVLLEITTQDHIVVAAKNLLFEGDGLRVVADQVHERINSLRTHGQYVRFNPNVKDTRRAPKPASALSPVGTSGPATVGSLAAAPTGASPAHPTKEQLYKAVFGTDVNVTQNSRKLTADTLEIFARLINNQLPENAFGVWEAAADEKGTVPKAGTAQPGTVAGTAKPAAPVTAVEARTPPMNEATALFIRGEEDITMSWSGSLIVTPIADGTNPPELSDGNHFAARFSADKSGGRSVVAMEDAAAGAKGECAQVSYAATKRMLTVSSGPAAPDVKFIANNVGRILVKSAKIDLGTGIATAMDGGQLLAVRPSKSGATLDAAPIDRNAPLPADQIRQITWNDQADFKFRTLGGRIQSTLEFAKFDGAVVARDRTSSLSCDSMKADFAAPPAGAKQQMALRHMHAEGHVMAIAGPRVLDPSRERPFLDPYISADKLDVAFAASKFDPDEVDPVRAVAVGAVKGASRDASIRGDSLEVSMARDEKRTIMATDVVGRGSVEFERSDGVGAKADSLHANPLLRTADLSGNVVLARGPSTVHCRQAEMDDTTGILRIVGAGQFDHEQVSGVQIGDAPSGSSAAKSDPTHVTATWTGSMIFNNSEGTLNASGDTKVVSTSTLQTQTLLADRLQLWMTPAVPATTVADGQPAAGGGAQASSDRKLLRAKAIGASEEREGAPHATIEVRKYAPATAAAPGGPPVLSGTRPNAPAILPPEASQSNVDGKSDRLLEQVFYIEGPVIEADEVAGTVTVPAAGRAIVRDQRAATSQALIANSSGVPAVGVAGQSSGAKGTSRFTWAESMQFVRSTGMLTMKKDVELIHLPLGSTQVTRLVAMRMDARFNTGKGGMGLAPGSAQRSAELVEATATGAVYAESGPQKLLCDRVSYDALRGTAEAGAIAGNKVTMHDDRKTTPLVAKRLFWDLVRDRVEIMEPATATLPR